MIETGESVVEVEQSAVLTESEVAQATADTPQVAEEASLPSDEVAFEVPDKFKGKSVEDVIKSYQELEKFKGNNVEPVEETTPKEGEDFTKEAYDKYATALDTNGALSEAEYAELAEAGYDKPTVDAEIANRSAAKEFQAYKQEKAILDIIEPLGGGKDKFKDVASWAKETKTEADVAAFNEALSGASKVAQQAMLRGLYSEYDSADVGPSGPLHTNTSAPVASKGYNTQEEFFKDIGSPEYKNNAAYRAQVEAKMSKSSIF